MTNILGPSWRTTLGGYLTIIGFAMKKHPVTLPWSEMVSEIGIGIGLLSARDNGVTSEQALGIVKDPAASSIAKSLLLFLFLSLAIVPNFGCATGTGSILTSPSTMAMVAKDAAYLGAIDRIQNHPDEREVFHIVDDALLSLIDSKDYNPEHFKQALQKLNVREFKGTKGTMVVSSAIVLWDLYSRPIASMDDGKYIKPVLEAVEEGIAGALKDTEAKSNP